MFSHIRSVFVLVLAGGVTWSCSGERVMTPQGTEAGLPARGPLSKPAVSRDVTLAVVVARVHQDQVPVSGATVEFSRSISGRVADYAWSATTEENGEARVYIGADNVSGYYQARAWQDGSVLGSWSSIPINGGYALRVDLPVGGKARVTGSSTHSLVVVDEGEAVQVRSLLSHTGAPSLGASLRYSVELAVRDFGSLHGHRIELGAPVDGMCSPQGGRAGAEQIIADPQVLGVIGTSCSGAAVEASPVLSAAGLVMVSPSNTSPLLTSDLKGNANSNYHPGYFRVSNNDIYQAKAVADFAYNELDLRRMAAVHDGDPYTTALVGAFDDEFRALGGEVAVTAAIEKGETDMMSVLVKFAAAGPDGIFFPLFRTEGSPFARQVRAFDGLEGVTLITGAAMLVSEFLGTPQSEAIYFAGPESDHGANVNVATGKDAEAVLTAFEATYGESPGTPYWAYAYDATTLLLSAIDSVVVEAGGKLYIDRTALRKEIRATAGFQGLIGTLSCDDFGDCGTGRINIYHHTDSSIMDTAQLPVVYRFVP